MQVKTEVRDGRKVYYATCPHCHNRMAGIEGHTLGGDPVEEVKRALESHIKREHPTGKAKKA